MYNKDLTYTIYNMAKKIIRLTENQFKQHIKSLIVETIMDEMGTPKQNALLRKLTGSSQYDNLSIKDASAKIDQLLKQQSSRPASEKQIAYLKKMYPKFADIITPENVTSSDASYIIGRIINNKDYNYGLTHFMHIVDTNRNNFVSTNLPVLISKHSFIDYQNDSTALKAAGGEMYQDKFYGIDMANLKWNKDMTVLFMVGNEGGEPQLATFCVVKNGDKVIKDGNPHKAVYISNFRGKNRFNNCLYIYWHNSLLGGNDERYLNILVNYLEDMYQSPKNMNK